MTTAPIRLRRRMHHVGSGSPQELWAQVNLPDGATVTEFRAYFRDNTTATNSLSIFLAKLNVVSGGYTLMGQATALAANTGLYSVADSTITSPVIDNTSNGYAFFANFATTDCSIISWAPVSPTPFSEAE